jgi:hypothetical protein
MWEEHEEFMPMLQQVWQNEPKATNLRELERKLASVAGHIGQWSIHSFGHVRQELKELNKRLEELQSDPHRGYANA